MEWESWSPKLGTTHHVVRLVLCIRFKAVSTLLWVFYIYHFTVHSLGTNLVSP